MSHGFVAEFRDRDAVLQSRLEHDISQARWNYDRIGGCGDFEVQVRRDFSDFPGVGLDWDMRLYKALEQAPLNRAVQFTNSGGYGFLNWSVGSAQYFDSILVHGHSVASGSGLRIQGGPVPQIRALQTDGVAGSYLSFAGFADLLALVGSGNSFSVGCTLTTGADVTAEQYLGGDNSAAGGDGSFFILIGVPDGVIQFTWKNTVDAQFSLTTTVAANTTYRFLWVYSASGNTVTLYKDGALADGPDATTGTLKDAVGAFTLFRPGSSNGTYITNGYLLDEFIVYGEALSAAQAVQDNAGTYTPTTTRLHLTFDEASGAPLDTSGNGYDATINGGLTRTTSINSPVDEAITHNPTTIIYPLTTSPRSFANWRVIATSLRTNAEAISEVFGYQRTVSSAESVRLQNQQVPPDPINRLVHFPLNENTGLTINDIGPYSFNGSIVGSMAWTGGNGSTISPGTRTLDIWYRGYVSEIEETNEGISGTVNVLRGHGYIGHLGRVLITASYQATKAESVVGDIIQNQGVTAKTSVVFCGTNVDTTSVSVTDVQFRNTPADRAITQIADLVGTREWGVDRQAAFFFRARRDPATAPASAYETFISGKDLTNLSITNRGDDLINSVFVEGGVEQGKTIIVESVNSQSQVDFGRRESAVTAASFVNSTDVAQVGASIIAEKASARNQVTFEIVNPTMVETKVLTGNTNSAPVISVVNASSRGNYLLAGVQYAVDAGRGFMGRVNAGEVILSPANYAAKVDMDVELIRQRNLQEVSEPMDTCIISNAQQKIFGINSEITYTDEVLDRSGMFSTSSNSIIKINNPGIYVVESMIYYSSVASGPVGRGVSLEVNSSGLGSWETQGVWRTITNSGLDVSHVIHSKHRLFQGDLLRFIIIDNSVTIVAGNERNICSVSRLGN